MIKLNPISWYNVEENKFSSTYNNRNLHTYDPYYQTDDKLFIDKEWWNSLIPYAQNLIREKIGLDKIELCHVVIPHPNSSGNLVTELYYVYLHAFDYNVWYHDGIKNGPKNVRMINLDSLKESLQKITRRRIITGDPLSEEDLEALLDLRTQIVDYFKVISLPKSIQQEQSVFARLSGTSGKNEISLEPLNSDMDVLHFMTNNRLFLNQEYNIDNKTTYLIMMPWNDQLNERYEFRIFVHNGKLTGISPQKWFALFQYSEEEIETIVEAMSNLRFLDDIPYKTLVADVWVNINGTQECYLIECNPFGAHCGAGSSLFSWITDYDQLHGKNDWAEFRYPSILKSI